MHPGEQADLVLLLNGYVFWAVRLETSLASAPPQPLVPGAFDLDALPFLRGALESGAFEDDPTPTTRTSSRASTGVLDGIGVLIGRRA